MQELPRDDNGQLSSWAWPGGYPIYYICKDNSVICPKCANELEIRNKEGFVEDDDYFTLASEEIAAADVNYEDNSLYCDECSGQIDSAYGED